MSSIIFKFDIKLDIWYHLIMDTKIDFDQLRYEIRHLNRHKALYRLLRDELTKIDHWKQQARGNPIKGYYIKEKKRGAQERHSNME